MRMYDGFTIIDSVHLKNRNIEVLIGRHETIVAGSYSVCYVCVYHHISNNKYFQDRRYTNIDEVYQDMMRRLEYSYGEREE